MLTIAADQIDFEAYRRRAECKAKVKSAHSYAADLDEEFDSVKTGHPTSFSLKLKNFVEFRPGEVTAWAGYSGHRKSMFTGQLALELGLQGHKTLIASFEMSPGKTLARMCRQFSGTDMPSPVQRSNFLAQTANKAWIFDHMGRCGTDEMLAVCRYFAEELKGTQIFIDSMMMVCNSEERLDEQKQFATSLVRLAQETGLHVHLIAHCRKPASGSEDQPPGKHDLRGSASVTDQCSNVITVWSNKAKMAKLADNPGDPTVMDQPDAVLNVCKQRNGGWEGMIRLDFANKSLRFVDSINAQTMRDWGSQ